MSVWTLVTSNPGKALEIKALTGLDLAHRSLDLREIQSMDLEEILQHKLSQACEKIGSGVIVEDTSLELSAYGGFPGPFVKWLLKTAGVEGLIQMAMAARDARAEAVCGIAGSDGSDPVLVVERIQGTISPVPRGSGGFGWDSIFVPDGSDLTFAEMNLDQKNKISHRSKAWNRFTRKLYS